jgi:hypothetical protein
MNTIDVRQNGYVSEPEIELPPQTVAGQLMKALGRGNGSFVQVEDAPNGLQTYLAFQDGEFVEHLAPAEVYDYQRDGVEFEPVQERLIELVVAPEPEEPAEDKPFKNVLNWPSLGVAMPSGVVNVRDEGNDIATMSIHLTMQKPSVTYQRVKAATKLAGGALLETIKDEWLPVETEVTPDKKRSVAAVAFICGDIVLSYAERLGNPSLPELINAVREDYPELTKEPQFQAAVNRLSRNPEGLKRAFAGLDRQAVADNLGSVPAFGEFCETYGIDANEVLKV